MKRQYLGDSKDSFKWDYHDYLMSELKYQYFNLALMLTPDDTTNEGKTKPESFKAKRSILRFCNDLREGNDVIENIQKLPQYTGARYQVKFHKGEAIFTNKARMEYFTGFNADLDQIVLLDPDNGFEPEKSCHYKHVSYTDVVKILEQVTQNSIVTIFQHFRRKSFSMDYERIKQRLGPYPSTAIYWNSLMFVVVSRSKTVINRIKGINERYKDCNTSKICLL